MSDTDFYEYIITLEIMVDVFRYSAMKYWLSRVASLALPGRQTHFAKETMFFSRDDKSPNDASTHMNIEFLRMIGYIDNDVYIDKSYMDGLVESLKILMKEVQRGINDGMQSPFLHRALLIMDKAQTEINTYSERQEFASEKWVKNDDYDPNIKKKPEEGQ